MTQDDLVRLSSWVFFVDHGEEVAIHHALSGGEWVTDQTVGHRLEAFAGFRTRDPELDLWLERGVFVRPFGDPLVAPPGSCEEGLLGAAWNAWYWKREVEAEREYRWRGEIVLKMPGDLFMYQELMFERDVRRVLEIGYGRGGGLWFFASILALGEGGLVVGVDLELPDRVPQFERYSTVRIDRIQGDGHAPDTRSRVAALSPSFDLVVVDADPTPSGKIDLLEIWAPLVAPNGTIVVEDLGTPECVAQGQDVMEGIDRFLLTHRHFGVGSRSRRFATGKAGRGVFHRVDAGASVIVDARRTSPSSPARSPRGPSGTSRFRIG